MSERAISTALRQLLQGTWRDPESGQRYGVSLQALRCEQNFVGQSEALLAPLHEGESLLVVSDEVTFEVLGQRVLHELQASTKFPRVGSFVWHAPKASAEGVETLRAKAADYQALVAVGSGTVSDSVKYATFLDGKHYSVFATSPMNAYTTSTASIAFKGIKRSIATHSAKGVFFDLEVVSAAPQRLIAAAFADIICRTTAQIDWLLSHRILETAYSPLPYRLLALAEEDLIQSAADLRKGKQKAVARLIEASAVMGLATSFTGTTHCGSMAEHGISHYIDSFAADDHPHSSHGEQVGIATLTVSQIQNRILGSKRPPQLKAERFPYEALVARYGAARAEDMRDQFEKKALSEDCIEHWNASWQRNWEAFVEPLRAVMRSYTVLWDAMTRVGAPRNARELGLRPSFYRQAVLDTRYLRDRFTILDIAGGSGQLAGLVEEFVLEHNESVIGQ